MANNLNFVLSSNGIWTATKTVTGNFSVHLESDTPGSFAVQQKSDPSAQHSAPTDTFVSTMVVDVQYEVIVPAVITITSTVPVSYGSIIEAD